jgi:hypothetical protein
MCGFEGAMSQLRAYGPSPGDSWASCTRSLPHHIQAPYSRVAVVAILFFICGLVLSLGTIAEPVRRGSLDGSGYGGCSLLSTTGSDSTGSSGPVLSIDVDITDDPGDEVATSYWTSPLEGHLELHGKVATGARGGYKLLARVDSGPIVELRKVVLDWDFESPQSGEDGRTPSGGPGFASRVRADRGDRPHVGNSHSCGGQLRPERGGDEPDDGVDCVRLERADAGRGLVGYYVL